VPGKGGYLAAFDGTWDFPNNPNRGGDFGGSTAIFKFFQEYSATDKQYQAGVGNGQDHPVHWAPWTWPNALVSLWSGAFGGAEANCQVDHMFQRIRLFYSNPQNRGIPLDLIGYSRGSFAAVKLANIIYQNGIQVPSGKPSQTQKFFPWIRFVGLLSPVNQMGPLAGSWPTALPPHVGYMYEALDNTPNDLIFKQTTLSAASGTPFNEVSFVPYNHPTIGVMWDVLDQLEAEARSAGVPI